MLPLARSPVEAKPVELTASQPTAIPVRPIVFSASLLLNALGWQQMGPSRGADGPRAADRAADTPTKAFANPSKGGSTRVRQDTPPSQSPPGSPSPSLDLAMPTASAQSALYTLTYDDGSPAPGPSQDFATAMFEQQAQFPKLDVPWILDYLAMQVILRGGAVKVGQLDDMLPEKKLAPYDITYACGNVSWITEKDYMIPLSLLKRYLWHLPSTIIPDRQEALELVKGNADASARHHDSLVRRGLKRHHQPRDAHPAAQA